MPPSARTLRAVSHLATTNAPASAEDSAYIQELLDDINKEEGDLHLKMSELDTQIEAIQCRLQELDRERAYLKPMISPLRRLPPELLGEIFGHALHDNHLLQQTLARLCRVCQSWREAAHIMPIFWQDLIVDPSLPSLSYGGVQNWVLRAKSLPVRMDVRARECGKGAGYSGGRTRNACRGQADCHFSKPVLAKILRETPSLSSVSFSCPTPECLKNLASSLATFGTSSLPSSWDSVESVGIMAIWKAEWVNIPPETFLFLPKSMSTLKLCLGPWDYASRRSWTLFHTAPDIDIPERKLEHLTSLDLTCDWTGDHILRLLRKCTQLKTMRLDLDGGNFSHWGPHSEIQEGLFDNGSTLPELHTLILENVNFNSIHNLGLIKIPGIRSLTVGRAEPYPGGDGHIIAPGQGASFASFVRGDQSTPSTLETLCIRGVVFTEDALLHTVKDLTSLKRLTLGGTVFDMHTFSKVSSLRLLPQLEALELLELHCDPNMFLGLQGFIEERGIKLTASRCTSA